MVSECKHEFIVGHTTVGKTQTGLKVCKNCLLTDSEIAKSKTIEMLYEQIEKLIHDNAELSKKVGQLEKENAELLSKIEQLQAREAELVGALERISAKTVSFGCAGNKVEYIKEQIMELNKNVADWRGGNESNNNSSTVG